MFIRSNLAIAALNSGKRDVALAQLKAIIDAPASTRPELLPQSKIVVGRALGVLGVYFKGKLDLGVESHLKALRHGLVGDEAWQGLANYLLSRYAKNGDIEDLRRAAICSLKAGDSLSLDGTIRVVGRWIEEDPLAEGLEVPRILVGAASVWRYQESTPESPEWRGRGFDATAWPAGKGKIGYGESDLDTAIGRGTSASACFRLELQLDREYDAPLRATIAHDDGGVVFVNGAEVYRGNIVPGPPHPDLPAPRIEALEATPHGFVIDPSAFQGKAGVIAVQIHQTRQGDRDGEDDLSFEFALTEPVPTLEAVLERLPREPLKDFFGDLVPIGGE